ncbi:hypothetical protein AKUH3B102A_PHAGE100310 (plasmid) [Apilactobacillus kunkeei]|nr:hypothetical protein AKUH3B102A_PHAGE100310 [Apilactobacillus kunkeei]CAI2700178.1 hypothetical protein AKUH3B107A_PHAGE100310 [Apilactobacillus kunkeei]
MTGKDKAKEMYENGMKYKDIAEALDISAGTIRSWRARDKWKRKKKNATQQKNVATKIESVAKNVATKKLSKQQSTDDKWKQFCLVYLRKHNATQAYIDVYDCSYETALVSGPRLLGNVRVKNYLDELKAEQVKELYLSALDVQREQAKIAFANLADYLTAKHIRQERLDPEGHPVVDVDGKPIIDEYDELILTNPEKADWSIISEVHRGKDGLVVKLYDKQKALDFLAKSLPDTTQARIDKAKADMLDTDNNEEMSQMEMLLSKLKDDSMKDEGVDDNE